MTAFANSAGLTESLIPSEVNCASRLILSDRTSTTEIPHVVVLYNA